MTIITELALLIVSIAGLVLSFSIYMLAYAMYSKSVQSGTVRPLSEALQGKDPVTIVDIPDTLREYIDKESEPWARTELEQRALELYKELDNDWPLVEVTLRNTISESADG